MLAAAGGGCSLGGSHPALSQPISQPGLHFGSLNYIETRRTSCDVGNKPCVPPPLWRLAHAPRTGAHAHGALRLIGPFSNTSWLVPGPTDHDDEVRTCPGGPGRPLLQRHRCHHGPDRDGLHLWL